MPINQIGDDGAVIGYKPHLEYQKALNVSPTTENTTSNDKNTNYSGEIEYSSTLSAFEQALPSGALNAIEASLNLLERLISSLQKDYSQGNWGEFNDVSTLVSAIKGGSKDFVEKFVEFHSQNINASIIPELIMYISESEERLKTLSFTLKNLYYGQENITVEEAKEIDKTLVAQLKHFEATQEIAKINYFSLAMDATLNRAVSVYTYGVNKECMKIAEIPHKQDSSSVPTSQAGLIKELYGEINNDIHARKTAYTDQQSIEIMQKALYNYYIKRGRTIELYHLFDGRDEEIMIGRKLIERQKAVNNALLNVSRVLNGHTYHLSEMTKLEQEKNFLMNIYSSLNYNTDNL